MTTSRIFSSTDEGAPVLGATVPGSLVNLLLACLVNGYGDKDPLGWTMPFSNAGANTAVFRNNPYTGSGCLLRVQDNAQAGTNGYWLQMYASMSSVDTGVDVMPKLTPSSGMKHGSGTGTPAVWYLIGDDRGFYFVLFPFIYSGSAQPLLGYVFYVGDIVSLIPSSNKLYGLFGNTLNWGYFGCNVEVPETAVYSGSYIYSWINRDPITNMVGCVPVKLIQNFRLQGATGAMQNIGASLGTIPSINGVPYSVGNSISIQGGTVVGSLPGLQAPILNTPNGLSTQADLQHKFYQQDGVIKLQVALSPAALNNSYNPYILIHIGAGFRI